MHETELVVGGRIVPDAFDRIRRYCGLVWAGGASETWAYRYFDAVPTEFDNVVTPVDVLTASALHPGLSRADLSFFWERGQDVSTWLAELDPQCPVDTAPESVLAHVATLCAFDREVGLSLLSKVMHRKRPALIPLVDRHVLDWYRPLTGERSAARAWPVLLTAMAGDVRAAIADQDVAQQGTALNQELLRVGLRPLSWLRMIDIAIWMGQR